MRTARVFGGLAFLLSIALHTGAPPVAAQLVRPDVIAIPRGQSHLLVQQAPVARVSIGDPEIADALVVTPREVLVNAFTQGTTTLIIWDVTGLRSTYTIEVTAVDFAAVERTLQALYPGEPVAATAVGNMIVLTGRVTTNAAARAAREIAGATGGVVVDNLIVQAPPQVLLQVRVAEVSRGAFEEFGSQIGAIINPFDPPELRGPGDAVIETISEGLMRLLLINPRVELDVILRALRTSTEFRSLAEPNLLAYEGTEASFLAGGEFPFPVAQPGVTQGAVTIEWREFGVRLNFTPFITAAGAIRLQVAPEVSQLDFATGLVISGFAIPSLLIRRAETEIELLDGQTFAIAGLLDNNTLESVTRLPVLGDIPVIGGLFRSRLRRENRTELLVLVTPRLVGPFDVPPPVPTGEPDTWDWDRHMLPVPPHPMPYPQPLPAPQSAVQP